MQLSVTAMESLLKGRHVLAAAAAWLFLAVLVVQAAELAHLHESLHEQSECEVCFSLSSGDDLLSAPELADPLRFNQHSHISIDLSAPVSIPTEANSRAPPVA